MERLEQQREQEGERMLAYADVCGRMQVERLEQQREQESERQRRTDVEKRRVEDEFANVSAQVLS